MTTHAWRIVAAVLTTLLGSAVVLLLGGRYDALAVVGSLIIGAGAGLGWLLRPRPGCWPFRRSSA